MPKEKELGDIFSAFYILFSLFFSTCFLAARRQAVGPMTDLAARVDTSAASSWMKRYTATRFPVGSVSGSRRS